MLTLCATLQPYLMVTLMFLGMAFCLPLSYLEQWRQRRRAAALAPEGAAKPLLESLPMEARPETLLLPSLAPS